MTYKTLEQIQAENLEIADRLTQNFGNAILDTVKSDYARYDLDAITNDLKTARTYGLVFNRSSGPELAGYLTPDEVIECFSKDQNFRSYYDLTTPADAISALNAKLETDAAHFATFSPKIQEERKAVFAQNAQSLNRMITTISEYAHLTEPEENIALEHTL